MSRRPCRVLLTGFEPFGAVRSNPSGLIARALGRDAGLKASGLVTAVLPVHRDQTPRVLEALLARHRPQVLVMTGVAVGRPHISVERTAVNWYRAPGSRGLGSRILAGGADGLFATLPLGASVRLLSRAGARAVISESAGTYACNLALYLALERARREPEGSARRIGFVHLPASPEALAPGQASPSQPLPEMLAAVRRLLAAELAR